MILFAPGPPTPPLHRLHPAVKELDRAIRGEQTFHGLVTELPGTTRSERGLQAVRAALVGKPLRPYVRTGARSRQKRLL